MMRLGRAVVAALAQALRLMLMLLSVGTLKLSDRLAAWGDALDAWARKVDR